MNILTLNLDTVQLTDKQFYKICQNNHKLKFERNTQGELIIMSPVGGESGNREADLIIRHLQKEKLKSIIIHKLLIILPCFLFPVPSFLEMSIDLGIWNRQTGLGYTFSSSTIFKLPNGSDRYPDVAWIRKDRWESRTREQRLH